MLDANRDLFFLLFAAGLGLAVAGVVNAVRAARGWVGGAVGLLAAGGTFAIVQPNISWHHAVAVGFLAAVGGCGWLLARGRAAAGWGLVAVCGAGLIGYGAVQYDLALARQVDADSAAIELAGDPRTLVPAGRTATDAGRLVELMTTATPRTAGEMAQADRRWAADPIWQGTAVRRGPAADTSNCHGWVFTGGRYLIRGASVPGILADNGYRPASDPRAGDLVIYSGSSGSVDHTAVVRAVADDGTVLVEGKWGSLGVYLHTAEGSPYGTRYTFYRSPRAGHLLAGVTGERTVGG